MSRSKLRRLRNLANEKDLQDISGFSELGRTGLNTWGGTINEEFLRELQGKRGIKVYREMTDNDPIVGAILFAIEMLFRQATWRVEAANDSNSATLAKDFLESCLYDMSSTWDETLSEILTFLPFGWSYHEIVYKYRKGDTGDGSTKSKFNDNLIGWRKLPIRAQSTLFEWGFDESGGIQGMRQQAPPNYDVIDIPIEKAILFRTKANKGNPEGRSVLRNAYRPWYFKKKFEEIEGIGVERDLAGLPMVTPPSSIPVWDKSNPIAMQMRAEAETLVRNIRRDRMEGIVKPSGWEIELLSSAGKRQMDVDKIINRYDQRIAMTVLADFILLGHQKVGSFALSSSKTNLFSTAIGAWLDSICEVFNRYAIPRLFALNPRFSKDDIPKLTHGDVESPDLDELGKFIKDMTGCGVLTPDIDLENYVREAANLPELPDDQESIDPRKYRRDKSKDPNNKVEHMDNEEMLEINPMEIDDEDDNKKNTKPRVTANKVQGLINKYLVKPGHK